MHYIFGDTRVFTGKRQLVSVRLGRVEVNRVLQSDANDYDPAVSPDGTKLVFASDRDGNPELYLLNLTIQPGPPPA